MSTIQPLALASHFLSEYSVTFLLRSEYVYITSLINCEGCVLRSSCKAKKTLIFLISIFQKELILELKRFLKKIFNLLKLLFSTYF